MNVPFSYASPTLSVEALKHSIAYKLMFIIGKDPAIANKHEWLNATLFAVRDRMVERWLRSTARSSPGKCAGVLSVDGVSDRPHPLECAAVAGHL